MRKRADEVLTERGFFLSRHQAQQAIKEGKILIEGKNVKPGSLVEITAAIRILKPPKYVGRGGEKLEDALRHLRISVEGKTVLDGGCSTGGFTDCVLQHGAKKVIAVDVGKGVLCYKLRKDPRVEVWEQVNLRLPPAELMEKWQKKIDLVLLDLSFISLCLIFPKIVQFLDTEGRVISLIKPQFELPASQVGKGGVIRHAELRKQAVEKVIACAQKSALFPAGFSPSPLLGAKGNQEFFLLFSQKAMAFTLPEVSAFQ